MSVTVAPPRRSEVPDHGQLVHCSIRHSHPRFAWTGPGYLLVEGHPLEAVNAPSRRAL